MTRVPKIVGVADKRNVVGGRVAITRVGCDAKVVGFSKACRWQIMSPNRGETKRWFIRNNVWKRMNKKCCTMTRETCTAESQTPEAQQKMVLERL